MTRRRGCASGCAPEGIDCRRTQSSAFGLYRATLMATAGRQSWSIAVHDAKGDPVGATLRIHGGAPRSGRVLTVGPLSTASDGRTIVDGFGPDAGEWWVLRLSIDGPPGRDVVTFNVIAQGRLGCGRVTSNTKRPKARRTP